MTSQKLISISEMCLLLNRDRRTVWTWVKLKQFPQPLRMNGRTIGWPELLYQAWLKEKMEMDGSHDAN
jgi:prophage regulatory protein